MLTIKKLKVSVEDKEIIKSLDLEVKPGEIQAIMGPNGSGKSTLAYTLAGHPNYQIKAGEMAIDGTKINDLPPDQRAKLGLFLAMQYPVAIPGLSVFSFLRQIYKLRVGAKTDVLDFRKWLQKQAELLDLNPELLKRSLNDGFSGGERKKLEILQMLVFAPKYIILDEIDSGLDIDALKKIALTVDRVARELKIGVVVITHYSRILEYMKPDRVHIFKDGKIAESGDKSLVDKVELIGYQRI